MARSTRPSESVRRLVLRGQGGRYLAVRTPRALRRSLSGERLTNWPRSPAAASSARGRAGEIEDVFLGARTRRRGHRTSHAWRRWAASGLGAAYREPISRRVLCRRLSVPRDRRGRPDLLARAGSSRGAAPLVMAKPSSAFRARNQECRNPLGWRFKPAHAGFSRAFDGQTERTWRSGGGCRARIRPSAPESQRRWATPSAGVQRRAHYGR